MERFRNLDWHPALEDMIDDVFIKDKRMERESTMYKIMTDTFTNPFEGIESEYANVNIELIKKYLHEDGEVSANTEDEDQQEDKDGGNSYMQEKEKPYVPGIRSASFYFPRRSRLDKAQQEMCLRVLLRLSNNEKKRMNNYERKEFEQYMALQNIISEEQQEFLEFVKSKWNDSYHWLIKCNEFVQSKWKAKMDRFKKLPRYYVESINIPLSVQKVDYKISDISVTLTSCLREGSFSEVVLPKLDRQHMLYTNCGKLFETYPPRVTHNKITQHFRLPVSEDTYCESLAIEAGADFVISSSGLKCLLNNIDSDHLDSWLVPVVVRSHCEKNIVYIDKRLPPTTATIPQKNTWVYKYILRHYFVKVKKDESSEKKDKEEDELEKAANHTDLGNESDSSNNHLKVYEQDLYDQDLSDIDKLEKSDDLADDKIDSKMDKQQNVSYKLFTIGSMEAPKHERIKLGVKEYKILVRAKTDGIEWLANKRWQPLMLTPKMEHQLALGAEAVTLEEGLHQWASLKFRPDTSLARVRIAADTSEIIQVERHTTKSLSNEINRLYNVKVEDSLSILYNIIKGLSSLTPGQYIMRHAPQNGPFAYVYKHTTENGKNVFDLHTLVCQSKFLTSKITPWPPIDKMMTTPAIRCFKRMPATFHPILQQKLPGRPKGRSKKKANVANNQALRRSVRLRKTNTERENAA